MCLIAFALDARPGLPLLLAANRDEYFDRPTAALHAWTMANGTDVLAGRDLKAGGTWLGVSFTGRVAMLTNVRSPEAGGHKRSRGELASLWLSGETIDTGALASAIDPDEFAAFNLVVGDLRHRDWRHLSNRDPDDPHGACTGHLWQQSLAPGIYALSNASLNTDWPKARRLQSALSAAVADAMEAAPGWQVGLQQALGDARAVPEHDLPCTGVPLDWESALASPFVRVMERGYGTRSSLIVRSRQDGHRCHVWLDEWVHEVDGTPSLQARWGSETHQQKRLELAL
jgi:uncharacterized protein with NRDE domain